jgi:hypothetical protein
MSAQALRIEPKCRACGRALTLLEMHYLDCGDGTATCEPCEAAWAEKVQAWRHGAPGEYPEHP